MRRLVLSAVLGLPGLAAGLLSAPAGAEVIRCADASGNVSYTDGTCPAGARQVGRVAEPPPPPPLPSQALPVPMPAPRGTTETPTSAAAPPAGPIVIDPRAAANTTGSEAASRWSDRGADDPVVVDYGYPYGNAYPGYRRPAPPRDMRPRIRNCDAGGCQDTQGNRYDNSGRLSNYRSLDGRTCQTVGTTQVCR